MELPHRVNMLTDKPPPATYRASGRSGSLLLFLFCIVHGGCAGIIPEPLPSSSGHLSVEPATTTPGGIPEIVGQIPLLLEPRPLQPLEKYTVVVNEMPVKELLFALARDAQVNVDIAPAIQGVVTLNAVEQTLPGLLDRIARQVGLRYVIENDNVIITPDEPYFRTYRVDYLNMERNTSNIVQIGTQIADAGGGAEGGGGSNNSTTTIGSSASNHFWSNLVANVSAILGLGGGNSGGESTVRNSVIPHPESGVLTVKATGAQHELLETLINETVTNANRQVLIQATIVEVSLTDQYQAGINWQVLNQAGLAGFNVTARTFASRPVNTASFFSLGYDDPDSDEGSVLRAALELLEEFGDVSVLSSPQIMALNNQSAILKVVDNVVYFEVGQETNTTQGVATNIFETTVKTVPVGIVMTITPYINANDSIILNVRPTISRINRFVNDPNPALTVNSPVPEIRVREMESMLRLSNGEIAVMGGLMQNDDRKSDNAIPGLSRIPFLGEAFRARRREYEKTELVIFLRPVIVRDPSLDGDFSPYKRFFPGDKNG